jgi:fatty-acyl-CoA synthase
MTSIDLAAGYPDPIAYYAAIEPARLAIRDLDRERDFSWSDLDALVGRATTVLLSTLGAPKGERVAVLMRNNIEQIALQFACGRLGAIFVPMNWRLTGAELSAVAEDATPSVIFYEADFGAVLPALEPFCTTLIEFGEMVAALDAAAPAPALPLSDPDAPMTLLYTSGTTGLPKGVIITERNAAASAANYGLGNRVGPTSVFLCDMPMFHTVGLFAMTRTSVQHGALMLLSTRFEAERTLARLRDPALGITHFFCVPQMAQMLRLQPTYRVGDLSRLTVFSTGGAPHAAAMIHRWLDEGVYMADGYGMTETGSGFGMPLDLAKIRAKAGSVGLPYIAMAVRLVDPQGNDVPVGEIGEIWMKGPGVSPGYWNQPEATAKAFKDGWLRSGDVGRLDADGYLYLVDRSKDMFISGGENVYPAEVEAAILALDAVAHVAVIGTADDTWGEVGVAYVVTAPGHSLDEATVIAHCRARIAAYKAPKVVMVVEDLPRTASGKVRKDVLRELHAATRN